MGRILAAVGKCLGSEGLSAPDMTLRIDGRDLFARGEFLLDGQSEREVSRMLRDKQLVWNEGEAADYPPHEECIEIEIDLAQGGDGQATILGADLTHGYVSENADYRS